VQVYSGRAPGTPDRNQDCGLDFQVGLISFDTCI